ncbi:MAG: SPOR domain-containing protein [Bacteroidales bacterium]|nr:SPOR domain-containing protein [Bacteroidales bacterium]
MHRKKAYSNLISSGRVLLIPVRHLATAIFLLLLLHPLQVHSQNLPEYDEIAIFLEIPRVGGIEIDAAIRDEEVYLPVTDLFDFLKIRNTPSPGLESISGFFINPEAVYTIDRNANVIVYQGKTYNLKPGDLIRTESNLYLKSSYYGQIFGLECTFNFRNLSVTVTSNLELPYIREMRQEEMRRNITRLKGELKADTNIGRTYPWFKFGMADWSVIATEEINGKAETRLNLSLGAMIAGGEATANLYYNSASPLTEKQQQYLWRYVNNDFKPLRQVLAGKIPTHATASLFNPVVGVQVTNTPTTFRRSFGSYTLSDRTEPGWIVELYINNVLVDYVKADASGFFTFEVPLVYGNSLVKLKFFGPWGEERTREQNINIPFNFLPPKTMEYTLSAGIVEDTLMSRFSRGSINYGLTRSLTVGGGLEYFSSLPSNQLMPYVNASFRVTNNLLLTGEYTHGVRAKGTLTYRMPSNLQLDLNYTWYDKDQKAIFYNYREERRATIAMPLRMGKLSTYQRLTLYQLVLPGAKYFTGEWMFSGSLFGVNTNLSTFGMFLDDADPYLYSNLALAFKIPGGFVVMPQTQFGYTPAEFLSAKIRVEKHLLEHAYLNLSYEQNFRNDLKLAEVGFRYDFSFAQTGLSVRQSNNITSMVQYARGSLINDRRTRYLGTDNRTNVGRGGISIIAFVDLNTNGIREAGEPKAYGLNLRANSGWIERSDRDTITRILGLEPYTNVLIELDPNSFDNISWRLAKQTMSVTVDPNILKLIEVPVIVAGEASGIVTLAEDGEENGIGRMIVEFYTGNNNPAGRTLTEQDGFYSYFGLTPGDYYVRVDTTQMRKLGMTSEPDKIAFKIDAGLEGDIVDGLDFTLSLIPDTTKIEAELPEEPVVRKDTAVMIVHEITQELITIAEDSWAIQLGAFKRRSYAEGYRRRIEKLTGRKIEIIMENDFYKLRILDLKTRQEVDENIEILRKAGIDVLWVINLKAKQQQLLLTERVDTVKKITEKVIEGPVPVFTFEMKIQVGAFRDEANALGLRDRLSALLDKPVVIVDEDGYHKVQITGFGNLGEIEAFLPKLGFLGITDIWIPQTRRPAEIIPPAIMLPDTAKVQPDTARKVIEEKVKIPVVKKKVEVPVPVIEEKPAAPEPTIALQAGVFRRKAEAIRAQRRIISRLNLPVEIVEQWGYYHVVIPGFFTREETYKYFPELAGLGYPGVSLIENYRSPNNQ